MQSENRTEWPTAAYLSELRKQGVFAYSEFITRAAMLAAFLVSVFLMSGTWSELIAACRDWYKSESLNGDQLAYIASLTQRALLVSTFLTLFAGVLAVLFQSRFFFSFIRLVFDVSAANPLRSVSLGVFFGTLGRAFLAVFLGACMGVIMLWFGVRDVLSIFVHGRDKFLSWLNVFFESTLPLILVCLLALGFVAFILTKISFMNSHRMTREEAKYE